MSYLNSNGLIFGRSARPLGDANRVNMLRNKAATGIPVVSGLGCPAAGIKQSVLRGRGARMAGNPQTHFCKHGAGGLKGDFAAAESLTDRPLELVLCTRLWPGLILDILAGVRAAKA